MLENIKSPKDLKQLNNEQLVMLCSEIREKLISTVSENGGHLASNLGIVELTVAVHTVFDSPNDSILFDVGHQSYVHKLLTGRYDSFNTIRKENGLSGFMSPSESEHDAFISGHSSNSISAACGIAKANALMGNSNYVIPIVGDGAMTGGMTFEALNNSGRSKEKLIIILNDNKMSISKNVGSLARHLTAIRTGRRYIHAKENLRSLVNRIPLVGNKINKILIRFKQLLKGALYNCNYFESLGYYYLGPIDGNNISAMIRALRSAKDISKPVIVHAITVKGNGYTPAEKNPTSYHGVSHFDLDIGYSANEDCYSNVFGEKLCELAETDDKICAITAAMTEGTGLVKFKEKYKSRFFDVGIAEQHAITYAAGLSSKGYKPVFAVYSSFLQRGYDQLVHDVAICDYNVTFAIDRAGIVGADGVTHQGIFDVAFLNTIPNIRVYSPSDYAELKYYLELAINENGACAVRYPRGNEDYSPEWANDSFADYSMHIGADNKSIAITYGGLFSNVARAADIGNFSVCKLNRIKPIPSGLIHQLAKFDKIIFFEEGIKSGGVAELIGSELIQAGFKGCYSIFAIDEFVPHCEVKSAYKRYGFDVDSILKIMNGDKK